MDPLPSLFVSHGAPTLVIEEGPARSFLAGLGGAFRRPRAIVAVSAHDIAGSVTVSSAPTHAAVHDFYGFPATLYEPRYAPPGEPLLAGEIVSLLQAAGVSAEGVSTPGIDHGVWVPLLLMYPGGDIPVVSVSLEASMSESKHVAIGRSLAGLRARDVLLVASGGFTHNLREFGRFAHDAPPAAYVGEFCDWMVGALERNDEAALTAWRTQAPHALRAHPTPEHLMPLFVAYGGGGAHPSTSRLHHSVTYGVLAMDAFAFH